MDYLIKANKLILRHGAKEAKKLTDLIIKGKHESIKPETAPEKIYWNNVNRAITKQIK